MSAKSLCTLPLVARPFLARWQRALRARASGAATLAASLFVGVLLLSTAELSRASAFLLPQLSRDPPQSASEPSCTPDKQLPEDNCDPRCGPCAICTCKQKCVILGGGRVCSIPAPKCILRSPVISGCCQSDDAECPDSDNKCTLKRCVGFTHQCQYPLAPDGQKCGDDMCNGLKFISKVCQDGSCKDVTVQDCDVDPRPCAIDTCNASNQDHCSTDDSQCGCMADADCEDHNPCTQNLCVNGNCQHPDLPGWKSVTCGLPKDIPRCSDNGVPAKAGRMLQRPMKLLKNAITLINEAPGDDDCKRTVRQANKAKNKLDKAQQLPRRRPDACAMVRETAMGIQRRIDHWLATSCRGAR